MIGFTIGYFQHFSIGTMLSHLAVILAFAVMPALLATASGWKSFFRQCFLQVLGFRLHIPKNPAVADAANGDEVHRLVDASF